MKYAAYGLIWQSDEPLPFVVVPADAPADAPADVIVTFDCDRPERARTDTFRRTLSRDESGFDLRYEAVDCHWGSYRYHLGSRQLDISTSRDFDLCWPPLVGVVPAVILRERGQTLLHGAVLSVGGLGIAIIGDSGAGKSTLSARLLMRGAAVVTDDLIVGRVGQAGIVERGYTNIAIYPETADALVVDNAARVGITRDDGKVQIQGKSEARPLTSLSAVIVLGIFDSTIAEPQLVRLTAPSAIAALRQKLYGSWIAPFSLADQAFCLAWGAQVPVYALNRPVGFQHMDATAALLEALVT